MKHKIIGTAGHIDHGKTALVKALTGIDTDRLKEEKERSITIDLGFAFMGDDIAFIDVPGHERFVKNMVAGIVGIDLALLVIAADDGIMPQTREHLDILRLLSIQRLVVALTKTDLVEDDWIELLKEDIVHLLHENTYQHTVIVPVSSITGKGIEDLKSILIRECESAAARQIERPFRLPVDRSFTMTGFGTVVTGTVLCGTLTHEEPVELLPQKTGLRLRGLQKHNKKVRRLEAGDRAAINFSGIQKREINRGDVVAHTGSYKPSTTVNCLLYYLKTAKKPLKYRERIRFHCGTTEAIGRVFTLEKDHVEPGESAPVQFQLEKPVVSSVADRFIVRRYSPAVTIGGGEILEIDAKHHGKRRKIEASYIERLSNKSLPERLCEYVAKSGMTPIPIRGIAVQFGIFSDTASNLLTKEHERVACIYSENDEYWIDKKSIDSFTENILHHIREYHKRFPEKPFIERSELQKAAGGDVHEYVWKQTLNTLVQNHNVTTDSNRIRLRDFKPSITAKVKNIQEQFIAYLEAKGAEGPTIDEAVAKLDVNINNFRAAVNILIAEKSVILAGGSFYYKREELERIESVIREIIGSNGSVTVATLRNSLNTNRKYALPLLNYFDDTGVTIRVGDERQLR